MNKDGKSKGKTGIIIVVIAIVVFAGITFNNYWKSRAQKIEEVKRHEIVPVQTAPSKLGYLEWSLELIGDIQPLMEVEVNPKVAGKIIEEIYVERGDFVKKGSLLAVLEKDTIRAQIKEAEAGIASARAKLKEVEANLNVLKKDRQRLKNLMKQHAVSQQKFDQIDAQYRAMLATKKLALAQIQSARASLNVLKILLKDHDIYAPISGCVSARYLDAGNMSDIRKPIFRISMEETVKIVTTVTEEDYPLIKKGMEAEIQVDAFPGKVFKGEISVINPTLDPATRTGQIEIHIPNKDLTLRSGMFAHIRLALGEKQALVIPKDGLNRLPGTGNYFAYVVEDGKSVMKNINIGMIQGTYVEVTEGLKEGEQVVVKGQNRLKDGTRVRVQGEGE